MKPRSLVFDLFGDYVRYRGGEVRLLDLIRVLEVFGVSDGTARVVMARLRREGWFDTRREGRETVYALNDKSWQLLDEGRERIFTRSRAPWDGQWHMVIYTVPETSRALREEVRRELAWLGFGPLGPSNWVSPHDRLDAVTRRFGEVASIRLDLLRCTSPGLEADREMARRCWDLAGLDADYDLFLRRHRPLLRHKTVAPAGSSALVQRMQLIQDYRHFPFRDPDLPLELLPGDWRGRRAQELFVEAHQLLGAAADDEFDRLAGSFGQRP